MNILYINITGSLSLGGSELCFLDVMATMRRTRPDWSLSLIVGEDGAFLKAAEAIGVSCQVQPLPNSIAKLGEAGLRDREGRPRGRLAMAASAAQAVPATSAYLARLRRAVRQAAPDCVHTNGMKSHLLGSWAAPRGVPVLWSIQDFVGSRAVMTRLLRLAARADISAVACAQAVADDASKALRGCVPVRTIYNAVDLDRFTPDGPAADLDAASGLPPAPAGTVRVGLIGTFARWKGQDVFLDAAARIAPELAAKARFYVVGGPIYRTGGSQWSMEELKARAEALGLTGRVGFPGFQSDPAVAIRGLDVLVHASTAPEPFGRVIAEGMACGKAVIAVKAGGSAELFEDGRTALGIPPDDSDALAQALTRLLADPALRLRIAAEGLASAPRFDRMALAGAWAEAYDGMPGRPGEATITAGPARPMRSA